MQVCDAAELVELAGSRGGLRNLRVVNLHSAIQDLFLAQLERLQAVEDASGSRVSSYAAEKGASGIQLHGSLRLAIFKDGRGYAIQLDATMARDLARKLDALADAAEAPPAAGEIH